MTTLYPYQAEGIARIDAELARGARRVLAVSPTGSGKGTMAAWLIARAVERGQRALFLVHRREIVRDVAARLRSGFGLRVGTVLPGERRDPGALVQVASVQSLIGRELPPADFVVPDEAHHYAADEWTKVLEHYATATMVGFTATPRRGDGRALGDAFDRLVIVATYSQLIASGHIVPCSVFRPRTHLGIDIAQGPVDGYVKYANGRAAFVFVDSVEEAIEVCAEFNKRGITAKAIHHRTKRGERKHALAGLRDGSVRVAVNVYTMTEGVDVQNVSAIVLARSCRDVSTYIQIVGRALRRFDGKFEAVLVDLNGASHLHGLPTDDREYFLEGSGIGCGSGRLDAEKRSRVTREPAVLGLELEHVGAPIRSLAERLEAFARDKGLSKEWALHTADALKPTRAER